MPRIQSAKKRVQVAERNRQRNIAFKSAVRTAIKKVVQAVQSKQTLDALKQALNLAQGKIDQAVLKGILHKNTAARYKSRLAKLVAATSAA